MASFTITGNSTTAQTLGDDEIGTVLSGASLITSTDAITGSGDVTVNILGTVVVDSARAVEHIGEDLNLFIGSTGFLSTTGFGTAVFAQVSDNVVLNNQGEIYGDRGIQVFGDSNSDLSITNAGTINGVTEGIRIGSDSASTDGFIVNTGLIVGGTAIEVVFGDDIDVVVKNSGTISSTDDGTAYEGQGGSDDIENSGSIFGSISTSGGNDELLNTGDIIGDIDLGSGSDTLRNTGSIVGEIDINGKLVNDGEIIGGFDNGSGGDIRNSGTISGGIINLDGATNTVVNTGEILEAILMSAGTDFFTNEGDGYALGVFGQAGNDTLLGGVRADAFDGGSENDSIRGREGEDSLEGGTGNDSVFGGPGDDELGGGSGDDQVRGGTGDDLILGIDGNDTLRGGDDQDTLLGGSNDDSLSGGSGNDEVSGDSSRDTLSGGSGDDTLSGGTGADDLRGGSGDDSLDGNEGSDTISGGKGHDTLAGSNGTDQLTGGKDADVFLFTNISESSVGSGRDVITDFTKGEDLIDLSAVTDGEFVFLGSASYTSSGAPEVRVTTNSSGDSLIRIDLDGDGTQDSQVSVLNETGLDASDFIL